MLVLKKDFLKTAVFALIVSIVVIFSIFEIKKFQNEEEGKEAEKRFVRFGSNEIKKIEFNEFTLERDGKKFTWKMTSPFTDYLNYSAVEKWVSKGLSQEGRNLSDGEEDLNWADFFLDHSDHKMIYTTDNGQSVSVQVSKKEAFDGSTYLKVLRNKEVQLYSSGADWKEVFSKEVKELRSLQLFNWEVPSPASSLQKISFYNKGKKYFSLIKTGDRWKSEDFKEWTFDKAKVDSFMSELKTYLHDGFVEDKVDLGSKVSTIVINTDNKEEYSLGFYKKKYAVANYRPEHVLRIDKNARDILMVDPLDLRSFKDIDGNFPNNELDQVQIKINGKIKKFYFEDSLWTVKNDKDEEKFNGARVFVFLNNLKEISYKRFVSSKGIVFKSAKKRIYLLKNDKEIIRYSIGQSFPCIAGDKKSKNCVLVATNRIQKAYMVALKKEVKNLFKFSFYEESK